MWWQYVSNSLEGIFILDSSREQNQRKRERRATYSKRPWVPSMTHFDRCAHGPVLLTPRQDASKPDARKRIYHPDCALCACTVYVNRYILCICMCLHAYLCACSFRTEEWAYERGVKSQGARHSHSRTLQNNEPHRPDWLVHPAVACNTPPGWPSPTICELLLQESGFKRGSL